MEVTMRYALQSLKPADNKHATQNLMVACMELVTHLASLPITIQTVSFLKCIPLLFIDFIDCATS
jgi:hypothetical protein